MAHLSLRHAWLLAVAISCLFGTPRGDALDDLIVSVEAVVNQVAENATEVYRKRFPEVVDCTCTEHACASEFMEGGDECHTELGDSKLCPGCTGQKLDFANSYVTTPPDMDLDNLTAEVKDDICTYHRVDEIFTDAQDDFGIRAWTYVATASGVMRTWPGSALARGDEVPEEQGDEKLGNCQLYDPRRRPWYSAVTSGPKDVVLLIDTSGSMMTVDGDDGKTRWDIVKEALLDLLDTFGVSDFINMVEFNRDIKSVVPKMVQATGKNLKLFKEEIESIVPTGGTDFLTGIETAFDLLISAEKINTPEAPTSTECQKIILFMTDGEDCTTKDDPCTAPIPNKTPVDHILDVIEEKQVELEKAGSERVHIFPFSFGLEADDEIPKEIACAHEGIWNRILPGDDVLFKMNSFVGYLAGRRRNADVIWSRIYEDAFGLGRVITAAKPIFSPDTSLGKDGRFVGVVGHDVRVGDIQEAAPDFLTGIQPFINRGVECTTTDFTGCELQILRGAEGECPEKFEKAGCYYFEEDNRYYWVQDALLMDYETADISCDTLGGTLAEIDSPQEEDILSGLATNAGSWLSLRRDGTPGEWRWKTSNETVDPDSDMWSFLGRKALQDPERECALIDRRGVRYNVHPERCSAQARPICEFRGPAIPDACQGGKILNITKDYEYNVRPLSTCQPEEQDIEEATAVSPAAAALSRDDVICPLGKQKSTVEVRCCDDCVA